MSAAEDEDLESLLFEQLARERELAREGEGVLDHDDDDHVTAGDDENGDSSSSESGEGIEMVPGAFDETGQISDAFAEHLLRLAVVSIGGCGAFVLSRTLSESRSGV